MHFIRVLYIMRLATPIISLELSVFREISGKVYYKYFRYVKSTWYPITISFRLTSLPSRNLRNEFARDEIGRCLLRIFFSRWRSVHISHLPCNPDDNIGEIEYLRTSRGKIYNEGKCLRAVLFIATKLIRF